MVKCLFAYSSQHTILLVQMLYDRSYMRMPFRRNSFSLTDKIMIILIIFFIFSSILSLFEGSFTFAGMFGCSVENLSSGYLWVFVTYSLLHETPWHLVLNLLGLHFITRHVELDISKKSFILFCIACVTIGSLFWISFNLDGGILIGSSALVSGSLTYYCLTRPNNPISLLLFFVLPVTLKPKVILLAFVGIELYGFIFTELQNMGKIAHSAHIGGIASGALFFLHNHSRSFFPGIKFVFPTSSPSTSLKKKASSEGHQSNVTISGDQKMMQAEVDRILDKINDLGFGSLTVEEKSILDKAKSLLRK